MGKDQACKIRMHAFITANELVGKGESWHKSTLIEPKD